MLLQYNEATLDRFDNANGHVSLSRYGNTWDANSTGHVIELFASSQLVQQTCFHQALCALALIEATQKH